MADSQNPEHVRKLIKEFQLKGVNLIPTVTGEIIPTVQLADLTSESRSDDRLCIAGGVEAAVAGEFGVFMLRNGANTGTLAILEQIVFGSDTDRVAWAIDTTLSALTTTYTEAFRDSRLAGAPNCSFASDTLVAPGGTYLYQGFAGIGGIQFDLHWLLAPGSQLRIHCLTANVTIRASMMWRERTLIPGE